ncbi:MAG: preprotein translocase subunit SecG [bacterium]
MDLKKILNISELVISALVIISILLQQQGSGLGSVFGGGGGESYRSKRGAEKILFNITIILIILFVSNGIAIAILNSK